MTTTSLRSWILKDHQQISCVQNADCSKAAFGARSVFPNPSCATAVVLQPTKIHLSTLLKNGQGGFLTQHLYTRKDLFCILVIMENPVQKSNMGKPDRGPKMGAQMMMIWKVRVREKVRVGEHHFLDGRRKMGSPWLLLTPQESISFTLAGASVKLQLSLTFNCWGIVLPCKCEAAINCIHLLSLGLLPH